MNFILLAIGLIILIKSSDILVSSAGKIAVLAKVPPFIIGLIVVSVGTSAPEIMIGVFSGIQRTNLITLGDVIGSNIANIALIIGLTAVVFPIRVDSQVPKREIPLSIITQVLLALFLFTDKKLDRIESVLLLLGTFLFLGYTVFQTRRLIDAEKPKNKYEEDVFHYIEEQDVNIGQAIENEIKPDNPLPDSEQNKDVKNTGETKISKQVLLMLLGLAGLFAGAQLSVTNAVEIARQFGMGEEMIGLTIVAFGTSLPELTACLMAAYKKQEDIAVGNIIGSNIINVLFVLGISGTIYPIAIQDSIFADLFFMIGLSMFLIIPAWLYGKITKYFGLILLMTYIVYLFLKLNHVI